MGHPQIDNSTPFAFEPLFLADEELRPVVVTVIKATYQFDAHGAVWLADRQVPVNLVGDRATDDPDGSYRHEPEVAPFKLATDVVLLGHAQPPSRGATQVDVGIRVGPVRKLAKVFGTRFWVWTHQGMVMSRAAELSPVPLTWENAFGGHDATRSTPDRPLFEPRNPVGTGFGRPLEREGDRLRLPNIEDPDHLIRDYGVDVPPCGFGFTCPNWQPRAAMAGSYDAKWDRDRKPLLPLDFDRRFFNAAPSGLVAPGYLRGDEDVVVLNTTTAPRLAFHLPAVPPPRCLVALRGRPDTHLQTQLDTVIVNTDEQQLTLIWRACAPAAGGPHDAIAIAVTPGN